MEKNFEAKNWSSKRPKKAKRGGILTAHSRKTSAVLAKERVIGSQLTNPGQTSVQGGDQAGEIATEDPTAEALQDQEVKAVEGEREDVLISTEGQPQATPEATQIPEIHHTVKEDIERGWIG